MSLESPEQSYSKQELWLHCEQEVQQLRDRLGKEIDSGIRETVVALRVLGFSTSGSCEGHLDYGIKAPWVDVGEVPADLADKLRLAQKSNQPLDEATEYQRKNVFKDLMAERVRLMKLVGEFYEDRNPQFASRLMLALGPDTVRIISQGALIQDLLPLNEQTQNLETYRQEMSVFSNFLKQRFFSS